jgi:hypothetical protein
MKENNRPPAFDRRPQTAEQGAHRQPAHTHSTTSPQVLRNARGHAVGEVRGNVLVRHAVGSKHQLRKPPAWVFDLQVLTRARLLGAAWCQITDMETGKVYTAPLRLFWSDGLRIDLGFGEQLALKLEHWDTTVAPVTQRPRRTGSPR